MSRASNFMTYKFPAWTYVAGQEAPALDWKAVPQTHGKTFLHVHKVIWKIAFTPTYGGGGADYPLTPGMNNVVSKLTITDGEHVKLQGDGGFNLVRLKERYSLGRPRLPEADVDLASGSQRVFRRVWHPGPPQMKGSPGDYLIPVGLMTANGSIGGTFGTLAQVSNGAAGSGVTALTATIQATVVLAMLDHFNIPPLYSWTTHSMVGNDLTVPMKNAKLESVVVLNSSNFDAISVGDFGNFDLDIGSGGSLVKSLAGDVLSAMYCDDFTPGEIGTVWGEPAVAGDDNHKQINRASPTALVAGAYDAQPVYFTAPDGRISKLPIVREALRLTNDGSQSTATVAIAKIVPRSLDYAAGMMNRIGIPAGKANLKLDTLSKKDVPPGSGLDLYLPLKVKV